MPVARAVLSPQKQLLCSVPILASEVSYGTNVSQISNMSSVLSCFKLSRYILYFSCCGGNIPNKDNWRKKEFVVAHSQKAICHLPSGGELERGSQSGSRQRRGAAQLMWFYALSDLGPGNGASHTLGGSHLFRLALWEPPTDLNPMNTIPCRTPDSQYNTAQTKLFIFILIVLTQFMIRSLPSIFLKYQFSQGSDLYLN